MSSLDIAPNRIPAPPIMEVVRDYLVSQGDRLGLETFKPYSIGLLAERADLNPDTLQKALDGRMKTIDFNTADRLLCVMNLCDLWCTDLADVYQQALLDDEGHSHRPRSATNTRICARRGCSDTFVVTSRSPKQKYCSPNCRSTAWSQEKRGLKTGRPRGKGRALEALVCRNGHERTPENTSYNYRGARLCRDCINESAVRYRAKRKLRLQAVT